MHKVVKPFPYSVDGFTLIDLNAGDERDFGAMTKGLEAEGFIAPVDKPAAVERAAVAEPVIETKPATVEEIETAVDQPRRGRPRK
jgi:hypothetical protein